MKEVLFKTFVIVLALNAIAVVAMTVVFTIASVFGEGTGPGCPGDPEWLGFCSEVPVK